MSWVCRTPRARPIQAALSSAAAFAAGALPPVLLVTVLPLTQIAWAVTVLSGRLFGAVV